MAEAHWYVVHTYSGYENKVKANIDKTIENRHLEDQILEVRVPMQDVVEMKNGAKKSVSKKMFPGYVLINMVMNDDTWYVVRNTRGVTGFVGPGAWSIKTGIFISDGFCDWLYWEKAGICKCDCRYYGNAFCRKPVCEFRDEMESVGGKVFMGADVRRYEYDMAERSGGTFCGMCTDDWAYMDF